MLRFRLTLVQWAPPLPRPHLPTPPLHLHPKPIRLSLRVSASDPRPSADGELEALLDLLPDRMRTRLASHPEMPHLIEVVMDLGRTPLARFPSGDFELARSPITFDDLHHGVSKVGEFGADNRAGISRTLHRISAIRNRNGVVVGLTCRVGREITGSADSLRDLVQAGASLLLIGPPGVGKTTIIREIARMLSDDYQKRVMIVDTSNEIGGDGDIPHPGIGNARRMQVPNLDMQHKVLIEAVENHMPQAIIIDEIGTKLEAMAASTIAQRGIQLVATAHGVTFENLIMNPSLEMLVGGIQSVTLGDEEASRRGVQKTILERKGPSTFTCGVEIISKTELRVHHSLEATVDALLSGRSPNVKICKMHSDGFTSEMVTLPSVNITDVASYQQSKLKLEDIFQRNNEIIRSSSVYAYDKAETPTPYSNGHQICLRLYVYGIPETKVMQAIKQVRMNEVVYLSDNINESDAFLALHSKLKKNPQIHAAAKSTRLPIYVTKTSSLEEIAKGIRTLIKEEDDGDDELKLDEIMPSEKLDALEEARLAIEQAVIPRGEPVDLLPRPSHVLSAQFDLIGKYNLKAVRATNELGDFIRILPVHSTIEDGHSKRQDANFYGHHHDIDDCSDNSASGTVRLPFLPE